MLSNSVTDAIEALCNYARLSCGADFVAALEVKEGGQGIAVASAPMHPLGGFNLKHSGILDRDRVSDLASFPESAAFYKLPMAIIHAIGSTPAFLLYMPITLAHAPLSGILFVWTKTLPHEIEASHWGMLANALASLMVLRKKTADQAVILNQFHDLFETTPSGIIFINGDAQEAVINERAAQLLGCKSGTLAADTLVQLMRILREKCTNQNELSAAYAEQLGNVNFTATVNWIFDDLTYKVDTHPIRGDGAHGRVWIFTDVTAEVFNAEELRRFAAYDVLTGVPNRRHFEECSAQLITARNTVNSSFAILMIDIDHFKKINDRYGHLVGDQVLQAIAANCQSSLRERDLFARYGGEEFIAFLVDCSENDALASAERLRRTIAARPVEVGSLSITVSISVGVAGAQLCNQNALKELINHADIALYQAKKSGRNRVKLYIKQN